MQGCRNLAMRVAVFLVAGLLASSTWGQETSGKATKNRLGSMKLVLEEFDGRSPNGKWEPHQAREPFEYRVKPNALTMATFIE